MTLEVFFLSFKSFNIIYTSKTTLEESKLEKNDANFTVKSCTSRNRTIEKVSVIRRGNSRIRMYTTHAAWLQTFPTKMWFLFLSTRGTVSVSTVRLETSHPSVPCSRCVRFLTSSHRTSSLQFWMPLQINLMLSSSSRSIWDDRREVVAIKSTNLVKFVATSHNRFPPKGSWGRELPLFQGNLGWWNIILWPDSIKSKEIV